MKKVFSSALGFSLLLALSSTPALSQTSKDILAKMIEAQGGAKAIQATRDTTLTGTIDLVQYGMSGAITMYQKEPDKIRMDIEVMGMVITQAYDGEIGWWVNPQTGTAEQMPDNMAQAIKRQALGNDALLNPEKVGVTYEFKGKEKVGDKEYLLLEQTLSDGHKTTMYIDPESYLIYMTKGKTLGQAGVEVMAETVFGDYKKVGDLVVAHSITSSQDGQEFMRMNITKVTFNSKLEDSFFKMSK